MRLLVALGAVLAAAVPGGAAGPAGARLVRVALEVQHTATESRDAVGGRGSVVITERGVRPRGALGAESGETRVRRSSGVFTLVQDGGESVLTLATQVPYPQLVFFRDYATGAGHVASATAWKEVGTSLRVRAILLGDGRIQVRLTPTISWFSADGAGAIELTEAATELVVPDGRPVVIGGGTTTVHAVMREVLGWGQRAGTGETRLVVTATTQ